LLLLGRRIVTNIVQGSEETPGGVTGALAPKPPGEEGGSAEEIENDPHVASYLKT